MADATAHTDAPHKAEDAAKPSQPSGVRTLRRVVPYLWPAGENVIKARVVVALAALVTAKVIAVGTPFFYKSAVDALAGETTTSEQILGLGAIGLVVAYGMSRLMSVAFRELREVAFARVGQRALRALALETITHVHELSMRYHITRKTGGLSRVIERGVKSVDFLLRLLLFNIGPLLLELVLISIVLVTFFSVWYLVIIAVTVILYVWFTAVITEWRVKIRREMNQKDQEANQKAVDALLNFETVKYFGAEGREASRYDQSMAGYEAASLRTVNSLAFLNLGQGFLVNGGLVLALGLAAYDVSRGNLTVGEFVLVNAYMMQVMGPLDLFGYVYREIRQALIDMAEMFDLLEQPAEIVDQEGAPELTFTGGEIRFEKVRFGYDPERPILNDIDLVVPPGSTIAIVGSSGSGKSTIGRLLYRFYDVSGGAIRIDGQDVREVTQNSLHASIGVVPQDTVLFNDTIYYNIAYGRPEATREDVEAVARAARIHDFVMSLPEAYDTQVGERGLKLSGGEKQRVGIARTMLKNPPILILDEATSALDTQTERDIQESLAAISEGRTVLTIAHRLSTVVDADKIVVLDQGVIHEAGTHGELLRANGKFAAMWKKQLKDVGEEA